MLSFLIGADASQAKSELLAVDKAFQKTAASSGAAAAKISGDAGGGHGFKSGLSRVVGDLINIGTQSTGAGQKVNALTHILGSLGSAAALVGLGAVVEKFVSLQEEALKTQEQLAELTRPQGNSAFRTESQITEHLSQVQTKQDAQGREAIEERPHKIFFGLLDTGGLLKDLRYLLKRPIQSHAANEAQDVQEHQSTSQTSQKDIDDLAEKQTALNEANRTGLQVSERQGELEKAGLQNEQRLGDIAALKHGDSKKEAAAENARYAIELQQINKKHDELEEELNLKQRIALLDQGIVQTQQQINQDGSASVGAASQILSLSKQRLVALEEQLGVLEKAAAAPDLPEHERQRRQTAAEEKRNEVVRAAYSESLKSPEQRAAELAEEHKFQRFADERARNKGLHNVRRDLNGNLIGGKNDAEQNVSFGSPDAFASLKRVGLRFGTDHASWARQFDKRGLSLADQIRAGVGDKSDAAKSSGGFSETDSKNLSDIASNTKGLGANK